MGQKVNPVAFRTGIVIGWKSRWYASKKEYAELLVEDQKIRNFIKKHPTKTQYRAAGIDRIEIERTRDEVRVLLHVAHPGLIFGYKGEDVEVLQEELQNLIGRRVNLKIEEVSRPEIQAQLVAEDLAQQIAKR
ncbi:MAG: 30S ribosomal protein S3, partial [Pirellulaceae bacterium]